MVTRPLLVTVLGATGYSNGSLPGQPVRLIVEREGRQEEITLTLGVRGEGAAARGYLGAGVAAGEWPAEMLREVSFGPLEALAEGGRRTWAMSL
ncbi:Zinc metalloprotease OS=Stutzerimonas stutzeri OX=316 GN=rseP PE=3 SV=1 [Stutzerimonas stutzeri]